MRWRVSSFSSPCQRGGSQLMNKKLYKFVAIFLLLLLIAVPLLRIIVR
jgi:hypothetical protein